MDWKVRAGSTPARSTRGIVVKLLGTIRLNHPKVLKKGFRVNVQTRNPERPETIPLFCPHSSMDRTHDYGS